MQDFTQSGVGGGGWNFPHPWNLEIEYGFSWEGMPPGSPSRKACLRVLERAFVCYYHRATILSPPPPNSKSCMKPCDGLQNAKKRRRKAWSILSHEWCQYLPWQTGWRWSILHMCSLFWPETNVLKLQHFAKASNSFLRWGVPFSPLST